MGGRSSAEPSPKDVKTRLAGGSPYRPQATENGLRVRSWVPLTSDFCILYSSMLHLILFPRIFDGLGSLFGRDVARRNVCAHIIENPTRVGTKQLIHCDLDPLRLLDLLDDLFAE